MIKASFGEHSWQTILHHSDLMRIYDIQLSMHEYPSQTMVLPFDSLIVLAEGQVFIESEIEDTSLKSNQAVWVKHNLPIRCVAISPTAHLFVVVFMQQTTRDKTKFERFASGTEHKQHLKSGITHWTVENRDLGKIEWIMLPANHVEPSYYLKDSEQFILPLNHDGALVVAYDLGKRETISNQGKVLEKGIARRLINSASKPITFLSVTTPYPKRNRILKLHGH